MGIKYYQLISNMGWRYFFYRLSHEIMVRTGLLKLRFPSSPKFKSFISLEEWKISSKNFFFQSREDLSIKRNPSAKLKDSFLKITEGKFYFFNYQLIDLGPNYDWLTNPITGYKYDIDEHWTKINDFNREAGDIKYVWEKSRFSYLYTIIRYDYHFQEDNSEFVFREINNWIDSNPINMGPNYKCSQEISLRILNWIFSLYFYKNSSFLTDSLFDKIINSIYWQLHHVYKNINFSRIAVRNNHAITETLTIYLVPLLFPWFKRSNIWKNRGKKWFEEEILYQIFDDGTYLQYSMNYHRVVIQLLTWAIKVSDCNNEPISNSIFERAYKSLNFLYQCQEDTSGLLPNYGPNDGALFFPLSDNDFLDFRPQLDALHNFLTGDQLYSNEQEDILWYSKLKTSPKFHPLTKQMGVQKFCYGGCFLIRDDKSFTFIKCCNYNTRPTHADNLHLDIWYKGENMIVDCGTYKYNAEEHIVGYFKGTASHNTVMLNGYDQMLKGDRFIWYNWSKVVNISINENDEYYEFTGLVSCFSYLSKDIEHERVVKKYKNIDKWEITDTIHNKPSNLNMNQIWHYINGRIIFNSDSENAKQDLSLYSKYYGQLEEAPRIVFTSTKNTITTTIEIQNENTTYSSIL